MLTIDHREKSLISFFPTANVKTLDLGDVLCEYDDGTSWLAERKSVDDLAASIIDGRWGDQKARITEYGGKCFIVIEGDLRQPRFKHGSLLGACVNAALSGFVVFRTWSISETKALLEQLVQKNLGSCGPAPTIVSKRKRNEDTVFIRMLTCVPSISESVARAIADHFGSVGALQQALQDASTFPEIRLSARAKLGKARVSKLAAALDVTRR